MAIDVTTRRFLFVDVAMKFGIYSGTTPPTTMKDPVNFTRLEFTNPPQEIERIASNMEGSIGQALATVQRPTGEAATLAAEFNAASSELIALALGATVTEVDITGASIVDEVVTPVLNEWVALANEWIDADATFLLETAGDVEIASTKYEVDYVNGMIKAIHADAAVSAKATYDTDTVAGEKYHAGQALSEFVMMKGTGTEQATGKRCQIIVVRANLAADGSFDIAASGALSGSLTGELETPSGYTGPWSYTYTDVDSSL